MRFTLCSLALGHFLDVVRHDAGEVRAAVLGGGTPTRARGSLLAACTKPTPTSRGRSVQETRHPYRGTPHAPSHNHHPHHRRRGGVNGPPRGVRGRRPRGRSPSTGEDEGSVPPKGSLSAHAGAGLPVHSVSHPPRGPPEAPSPQPRLAHGGPLLAPVSGASRRSDGSGGPRPRQLVCGSRKCDWQVESSEAPRSAARTPHFTATRVNCGFPTSGRRAAPTRCGACVLPLGEPTSGFEPLTPSLRVKCSTS